MVHRNYFNAHSIILILLWCLFDQAGGFLPAFTTKHWKPIFILPPGSKIASLIHRDSAIFLFRLQKSEGGNANANEKESANAATGTTTTTQRVQNVKFAAPLLEYGYPPAVQNMLSDNQNESLQDRPILLYLPGFDGTYIAPFIQFPELSTEFEVWCMTVGMNDRSTFDELKLNVIDFLEEISKNPMEDQPSSTNSADQDTQEMKQEATTKSGGAAFWSGWFTGSGASVSKKNRRPIYLAGESFGGILASEVALTILAERKDTINLKGLVLINPATCYDRSQLAAKGPSVYKLPPLLYPFGLAQLVPLFTDEYSFQQLVLILQAKALPSVIDTPAREAYMGRVAISLPTKLEYMPQPTLEWRLEQWLGVGCARMTSRMKKFRDYPSFSTLIIAGEKDLTLPSIAEAERLLNVLPNSQVYVVEGAGHASTCGSRIDMTAVLRQRFSELRQGHESSGSRDKINSSKSSMATDTIIFSGAGNVENKNLVTHTKRTAMKPQARIGVGPNFGMEPRYDGANVGLNPLLYWSKEYFQPVQRTEVKRKARTKFGTRIYQKATYKLAEA